MNPSIVFDMDQDDDQVSEDSTDSVRLAASITNPFLREKQRSTHNAHPPRDIKVIYCYIKLYKII